MDLIIKTIKGWIYEKETDSRRKRFIKNALRSGFELILCVLILCVMAPSWENKGFFPSIFGGMFNLFCCALIIGCVINSIQAMVRALQLFNEYRYDKKCGFEENPDEE